MGDSDEEYGDSRRREKFRRERSDYVSDAPAVRVTRPPRREDWPERDWNRGGPGPRRDYRDYPPRNMDRPRGYSPGRALDGPPGSPPPPAKRPRSDWPDRGFGGFDPGFPGYGGHGGYTGIGGEPGGFGGPHFPPYGGSHPPLPALPPSAISIIPPMEVDYPTQSAMMSFKAFLATQSDDISDDDAIKKYNDYKLEFRRQQINDFFLAHMEEEWFKMKYHPVDSVKRKEEQSTALKHRLEVFKDLYYRKFMTNLTVDADMAEGLVRLLDTVVIKLEGGTDHDLKVLDQGPPPDTMVGPNKREGQTEEDALKAKAKALLSKGESSDPAKKDQDVPKKKRARTDNEDGSSSSGEDSGNEDEELVPPGMETKKVDEDGEGKDQEGEEEEKSDDVEEKSIVEPPVKKEPESESTEEARALHKTASIFLRSIHPSVTRAEIENLCTKYPGYLRCAIADPAPERRWFRRGWVTFERNTNVKEICWNLNNTRLKDVELGAILNRDLSRRIRTVSGLTCHKSVVRNDIRIAAKVVMALDDKAGLWKDEDEVEDAPKQTYGIQSKNPLMHNITEYMIEEASAEEDELVGAGGDVEKKSEDDGCDLERDEELITVLDRLILYLRIVHSVDFYNHSEYPNEDEMPNRCGIMHTRGIPPMTKLTQKELADYMKNFETKMSPYMEIPALLTSDEAKKFGLKDVDEEIEKFVKANTQELAQDKWLCPLSGKKFRGPDFVRKHIFNKHEDKIEDVKREVEFFNNYVRDPRRPALPEHPSAGAGGGVGGGHLGSGAYGGNATVAALASAAASSPAVAAAMAAVVGGRHGGSPDMMPRYGFGGRDHGNGYGGRPGRDFSPRGGGRRGSGGFPGGRGRGRADPRAMVGYHDLDAPEEVDIY